MRRRDFVAAVGGAAAWPLLARAQQAMPAVGFLRSTALADAAHLVTAFRLGLKEAGFVEGQNVAIEFRSAEDRNDRLPALVADLLRRKVAAIVGDTPSALAAKAATTTVPIVFATGSDPVRDGLVASLNRPGGNVTGVVFFNAVLGGEATGTAAPARAQGDNNRHARESEHSQYRGGATRRAGRSASGRAATRLFSMLAAPTTSTQPLQRSSSAAPVRCSSVLARSSTPIGNDSSRWRPAMRCQRCIPIARPSWPVA